MCEPFNGVQNNQLFPPQHFAEQENLQYFKVTKRLAEKRQNYKLELNTRNITHRIVAVNYFLVDKLALRRNFIITEGSFVKFRLLTSCDISCFVKTVK